MIRCLTNLFLALGLLVSLAQAAPSELDSQQKQHLVDAVGRRLEKNAYAFKTDFSQWPKFVADHQTEIDNATTKNELATILDKALAQFELSHLGLSSPDAVKTQRAGQRTGIGISIHQMENGGGLISYVLADSPAQLCGLQKGDILKSIDNTPLTDIQQLAGTLGQKRALTWQRGDELHSAEIEYAAFNFSEPSQMEWLREDVAVIQIQSFMRPYYRAAAVNRFFREARHAKAIIIDLRNNRGGLSLYSRHLASKISPCKETFAQLAKKRHETSAGKNKLIHPLPFSRPYHGTIIILVDSLSASAADIFPAFVSETKRGIVIGQKTSGALQLARTWPMPYGFRIYLPVAEMLTPTGNRLEKTGFLPNVELSMEETLNDDTIFAKALELIDNAPNLK